MSKIFGGPQALSINQIKIEKKYQQTLLFHAQYEFYKFSAFIWGTMHYWNSKVLKFEYFHCNIQWNLLTYSG